MNIETMIYAYLAICSSMIVFNCVCIFVFRRRSAVLEKRSSRLEERIAMQIRRIDAGEPVEESHRAYLRKKLARTNGLMAFDETLDRMTKQEPEAVRRYLAELTQVFTYLAMENKYHSAMKMTYFAYVITKYRIIEGKPVNVILDIMMKLLREPSLYCRENALQAVYSAGDCGCVLRALQAVDENPHFHHAKLLTDGLLKFGGDRAQLTGALWKSFEEFSVRMQVVILDYIRFSGGGMHEEVLQLLADQNRDNELRFSCIRYFGKYPYEPAFPLLIAFAGQEDSRWEYAAIAATALASYPCPRSIEVLKRDLNSSNWYIRFNAAKSLESFHLPYMDLSDVLDGKDRYAREILQYQLDLKKAREGKEAALT